MRRDRNGLTPNRVTTGQAILSGWLLCGVLDITAACVQAWLNELAAAGHPHGVRRHANRLGGSTRAVEQSSGQS
jgi:hypothetical protein